MVFVADTRAYSGWQAWFANLYNESHFYFTLLTITLIPPIAVFLGALTDKILAALGVDLRKRTVGEH